MQNLHSFWIMNALYAMLVVVLPVCQGGFQAVAAATVAHDAAVASPPGERLVPAQPRKGCAVLLVVSLLFGQGGKFCLWEDGVMIFLSFPFTVLVDVSMSV
jgi:hypothetical protein